MIRKIPICVLFAMSLTKMKHLSSCICLEIISLYEGVEVVFLEFSITLYLDLIAIRLLDIFQIVSSLEFNVNHHCQNWAMSVSCHPARNSSH